MNKFVLILLGISVLTTGFTVQATTDAEIQALLNQAYSSMTGGNTSSTPNLLNAPTTNTAGTNTTTQKTTKQTVKVERLNYSPTVPDTYVKLNSIVSINIRTAASATTPIEIFLLGFDANSNPVKKIFIKNVYNEKPNVVKQYKLMINQDILDQAKRADWVQVGYCVGGCKVSKSKMIKGRIILPRIQPTSSSN